MIVYPKFFLQNAFNLFKFHQKGKAQIEIGILCLSVVANTKFLSLLTVKLTLKQFPVYGWIEPLLTPKLFLKILNNFLAIDSEQFNQMVETWTILGKAFEKAQTKTTGN